MDYQTQIDNLIELAIVQRDELKQLVEQLPQLREYLSAEVEKKIEAIEPELRQELEEFFARKTEERVDVLRGDVSERVAEMLKSLEMAAAAKYSALMNERARNAELLSQAEQKIADAAATIPSKVKDIVLDELSRFPRANQIDQLRKEFAEPRGLNPRGKWQTGERYQKLDLVSYNGESYISNVDDNTEKPSRFSASWTLSAARGQGGGGGPSSLNDLTQPPSDGTLLIGSGTSWVNGNIIGGTGVTVTNQPGSILIDATGAQEILTATVKNAESVAITKGQVVYLFGATGNMASVKLASNTSDATSAKTFGVVSSTSISAGGTGTVTCVGVLDGLNLGTYNEGDTVYLGATPGTFTATKPYAPNHLVYVGIVERANAGNGELYVKIQNGYELDEIHDVQINAPKLAGQTLLYDATTDLWKNARLTGTANQITVTNADAAVTLSIPNNPIFKGTTTVATTGGVATHVLEYAGGNSLFTGYNGTNSVFAQNGGAAMTLSNSVTIAAAGSNQPITLTPSGAATAGGLSLSRLTSTNQTLALLNYGTDELMSIVGTGYTGVGSRSNTPFILYSNNTERARFLAGGNFLIGATIDSSNGRLQLGDHTTTAGGIGFGADISLSRSASAQLDLTVSSGAPTFRFMNGAVYRGYVGTNGATTVLNSQSGEIQLQTSNAIALLLSANQNATFYKDVFLGSNGPSVPGTLSARAPRQGLVFDGSASANASTVAAIGSGDYTVHVVFKAESPTTPLRLVQVGQSGVAQGFQFGTTDSAPAGRLVVRNGDASAQLFGSTVLTANRWYAATAVRASGVVTIYLNGQGEVVGSLATNYSNGTGGMTIHGSPGNYAGTVETAIIYNRALSQDEVRQLYENGAPAAQDIVPQVAGTQLITGNNSTFAGPGSWTATFGSGTSTVSGGKLLINGGATTYGGSGFMGAALSGTYFVKGYRYRVTVDIDALSSGTLNICEGTGLAPLVTFSGTGTKTADVLVPMSSTDAAVVLCFSVASATATIDNITLVPLGAVIAPDATQTGSGLTWYDTSGNAANITLPASGVRWNVPFNGRIQFADGTTAAPSLTFSSAPTTGFFRLSSTQIGCTFSGALAGYIWSPSANTIRFSGNSQGYFESASAGAMSVVAGGTNQSISLNPSGTGIATVVSSALNQPAVMRLTVPGTATAGAYTSFYRTGVIEWQAGVGTDNSSFRVSPNGLGISDSLVLTNLGNATIGGTLTVNGGATAIVGAAGGATTYTVLRNSATNISIWGSRASIDGGNAADVGLYVYGANELSFWTNSTRSAWISGSSVFNTVGSANFGGNTAVVNSADARILAQRTALSLNTISQVVLAQGSSLFGASDRTYQLVSNGESATAAYFGIQYWDGSAYSLRLKIDSAGTTTFTGAAIAQTLSTNGQVGMTVTNNNAGTGAFASYQTWNGTTGLNLITWGSAFTGRTNENWIYSVGAYPLRFGTDSTIRMMLGGSSGNLLIAGTNDTNNYRVKIYGASTSVVEGLAVYNSTPYAAGSPAESRVSLGRLESSTLQDMGAIGALPSSDTSSANGDLVFHARNTNALALVGRWRYTGNLIIGPSGTADNSNGKLQLASHTAITGGIGFGADVSLYRAAANTLKLELGTAAGVLWFDNGGLGTGGARILGSSGALTVTSNGTNPLYLQTGGTTRILIDSGGNSTFTGDVLFSANNTYDVGTTSNRARALYVRDLFVTNYTPGSATDTGVAGRVCYDTNYIYICTATNTWKRVAIATWP